MALTPDEVYRIARLARLELTPEEAERFPPQLAELVGYVDRLAQFDGAESAEPGFPVSREPEETTVDRTRLETLPRRRILDQAPESREGFFIVPEVRGGD